MKPELLAPAGGYDAALAAFQYGADAVYLGLSQFSARAGADNFTPECLRLLLAYSKTFQPAKKVYVTFNTLVQDNELQQAIETLDTLADLLPDGVIVQDLGIARLIRDHFPDLTLHASTQLAAHNLDGVLALKTLGFSRVVLARELTLTEIRHIVQTSGVEIEIFVHGALCYCVSGLCLFSSLITGRSGNRGRCAYCCREAFQTHAPDDTTSAQLSYPFSMRDLALAPLLNHVVATGVHALKIEGRMKNPLYVACVTDYYRKKLDGCLTPETEQTLIQDLQTIFSRPWTSLYAVSADALPNTIIDPISIGHRGAQIGEVITVFKARDDTRWLRFITNRALEKHDGIQVDLPSGGKPFGCAVGLLRAANTQRAVIMLPAGSIAEVALPDDSPTIPHGAPVFCSASQAVRRYYAIHSIRDSSIVFGHIVDFKITLSPAGLNAYASTTFDTLSADVTTETFLPMLLEPSRQPEQTLPAIRKAFERLGDTHWRLGTLTLDDPQTCYAPPSKLNELRRTVLKKLTAIWAERRTTRRTAIATAWAIGVSPSPPATTTPNRWSLKLRAATTTLPSNTLEKLDTLVLAIGHASLETLKQQLDNWTNHFPHNRIRLALPLLTRDYERSRLAETITALHLAGWRNWECAELSSYWLLREYGILPVSADWSFYALNRVAQAELGSLGITMHVLSPENGCANIRTLGQVRKLAPLNELLVYQHTPLFISETAPDLPVSAHIPVMLSDRHHNYFTVQHLDNRWITVANTAFCIADQLDKTELNAFRIDLSWSPDSTNFPSVIQTVHAGHLPPNTHSGCFNRSLA